MRIVIDLQGAQGESRFRGIGRWSLWFAKSFIKNSSKHDVHLLLNGLYQDSIDDIRHQFENILPQSNIHVWYPLKNTAYIFFGESKERAISEEIYKHTVDQIMPDILVITSLFEGFGDFGVVTTDKNANYDVYTVVYDLIPLVFPNLYFNNKNFKLSYEKVISLLKKSDYFLSISQYTKEEIKKYLNISDDRIKNIGSAVLSEECLNKSLKEKIFKKKYKIYKPFLLCVMSPDHRKNFEGLIEAYCNLEKNILKDHHLVLITRMFDNQANYLNKKINELGSDIIDSIIVFSDLDDITLNTFYINAKAVIYPSHYEGFGLSVLEAMSFGKAVICGNNSSMPDIINYKDAMFDSYNISEMTNKISRLLTDDNFRKSLADHGKIESFNFSWNNVAKDALEFISDKSAKLKYHSERDGMASIASIIQKNKISENDFLILDIVKNIVKSGNLRAKKKVFIDVSEIVKRYAFTGIQRVVRNVISNLYALYSDIDYIYVDNDSNYRSLEKKNIHDFKCYVSDRYVEFHSGDVFLALDLFFQIKDKKDYFSDLKNRGVKIVFFVYDLLPVIRSSYFPENISILFNEWLYFASEISDQIICISKAVEDDLKNWILENDIERRRPLEITHINLGSDVESSMPTIGIPEDADSMFNLLTSKINFLMVGTVEPRKGHRQTLKAFDDLWAEGIDVNLVIVGKQGWQMEDFVELLNTHPERNKRLFWLSSISDEYLEKIYSHSTCLIAASEGEGYGLPLVEAAKHTLPIIARDIPVFREVSQNYAFFFDGLDSLSLSSKIKEWIDLYKNNQHPSSRDIKLITWKESAEQVLDILIGKEEVQKKSQTIKFDQKDDSPFVGEIDFSKSKIKHLQKVEGLSNNETWGRWSDANLHDSIVLNFKKQLPNRFDLKITGITFGDNACSNMLIKIGDKTYILHLESEFEKTIFVDLEDDIVYGIEMFPPNPQHPGNGDMRKIAVGLKKIEVKEFKD
jgi:glycosyltransferase involved in cell wall biosynthesis